MSRHALLELEAEALFVLRECAGQFDRSTILFSGGKDSIVLTKLAKIAFFPARPPFNLLHIDTGHNFEETLRFRDRLAEEDGWTLEVRHVADSIAQGRVSEEPGRYPSRNSLQSVTLLDAIAELRIECAIGGARRDEERARAKERFFSLRGSSGGWEPRQQRPEVWKILNGTRRFGEHIRAFPLSNWTELDVWNYIKLRNIEVPSLYFSHERRVIRHGAVWLAESVFVDPRGQTAEMKRIRFRTIGDTTCTGAIESEAESVDDIIGELQGLRLSERSTRADDARSEAAMENRKRQGYF